ncbi:hypothetical protein [Streptomyces sp. DH12]|uniref:hypothetical protein n=1 Tax=Streptomyces sp. DH12 TaxID=2857010 RepID=UPI001E2D0B37|nr:hypothetical protein [Streptomyces sp. DH12]
MGWASASRIFEPAADAMLRTGATAAQKTEVLSALVKALLEGDWDTAEESLGLYEDDPAIVEAFRRHGIVVECGAERDLLSGWSVCQEERGHVGCHRDWQGREW